MEKNERGHTGRLIIHEGRNEVKKVENHWFKGTPVSFDIWGGGEMLGPVRKHG